MSLTPKKASESLTIMTEIVLPNDTNVIGNLMGGKLLHWMDIAAAITAQRHCGRVVVTASVNNVNFNQPIKLGEVVTIESKVSRAFSSSNTPSTIPAVGDSVSFRISLVGPLMTTGFSRTSTSPR